MIWLSCLYPKWNHMCHKGGISLKIKSNKKKRGKDIRDDSPPHLDLTLPLVNVTGGAAVFGKVAEGTSESPPTVNSL